MHLLSEHLRGLCQTGVAPQKLLKDKFLLCELHKVQFYLNWGFVHMAHSGGSL